MNETELKQILQRSLEDFSLSRSERQALRDYLQDLNVGDAELTLVRQQAFRAARQALSSGTTERILDWLEEIVKLLQHLAASRESLRTAEAYFSPADNCAGRIILLIEQAQRRADICVFTITDDRIATALLAAFHRGVAVRIVTDREKAGDLGSDIERLRAAGVPVRVDPDVQHMHHKYAIFDDRHLVTGSYNWTRGAANRNKENLVVSTDPYLVNLFVKNFAWLWESLG
jgi:phosphatidylserine/phosphatidylglycerophosphate/cardiolipin synthase-like enzyme